MKIIQFEERYRQDFIDFNTAWIVSNFGFLEKHDIETFEKIDDELRKGAMIFFVVGHRYHSFLAYYCITFCITCPLF